MVSEVAKQMDALLDSVVLILVVVEDGLRVYSTLIYWIFAMVLILVVVEDGLRVLPVNGTFKTM